MDGDQIIITIIDLFFIFLFAILCLQGHADAQKLQRMKKNECIGYINPIFENVSVQRA